LVIIGGGVIGCAIALQARAERRSVVLVDAGLDLGLGATDAAMGGILTQTESSCLGELSGVIKRSRDIYPHWLAELRDISGAKVHVLKGGDIQVALDDVELARLQNDVLPKWKASPFAVEQLTAREARDLEPLLSEKVVGGFLLPEELALDPRELMTSLREALKQSGISLRLGRRARKVSSGPLGASVHLDDGTQIGAESVVVAAGHLSGTLLPQLRGAIGPIKGQAFDLRVPDAHTYPLRHHIYAEIEYAGEPGYPYLVPRIDGRLAAGVTYEEVFTEEGPTTKGIADITSWIAELMPASAGWKMERAWAGLRPATADHIPVIGYVDDHDRLIAATGHAGLGVTLAPVTAELVSAVLNGYHDESSRRMLEICRPDRSYEPALAVAPAF